MQDGKRTGLLLFAILFLAVGSYGSWSGAPGAEIWAIGTRLGLLCGVVWLAWPDLTRISFRVVWPVMLPAGILAIVLVFRPKFFLFALVGVVAAALANFLARRVVVWLGKKSNH